MENPWNGIVRNKSDKWVICLWDTSTITGGDKKWHGKALAPGRRSPNWLDVDGVTALERTVAISGWQEWWWLDGGAEADIQTNGSALNISKTSRTGGLRQVTTAQVDTFGANIDTGQDVNWGEKL